MITVTQCTRMVWLQRRSVPGWYDFSDAVYPHGMTTATQCTRMVRLHWRSVPTWYHYSDVVYPHGMTTLTQYTRMVWLQWSSVLAWYDYTDECTRVWLHWRSIRMTTDAVCLESPMWIKWLLTASRGGWESPLLQQRGLGTPVIGYAPWCRVLKDEGCPPPRTVPFVTNNRARGN